MSNEIDLSAYPIVRIDQISLLNDALLEKVDLEINSLLTSSNNSNAGLRKYLIKQANVMADEISRRKAFDRVQKLLSGAQELLTVSYSPIPTPRQVETSNKNDQQRGLLDSVRNIEPVRPSLPLERSTRPAPVQQAAPSSSTSSQIVEEPMLLLSNIPTDSIVSARSHNVASAAKEQQSLAPHNDDKETTPRSSHTARSTTSSNGIGRSRRISSYSQQQLEENLPSKKSLAIINKNFGNEFIVAATEKKKRFFPQKKVDNTNTEEAKRKERLERRRVAMERLTKRREKQDELKAKLREIKRLEKDMTRKARQPSSSQSQSTATATIDDNDDDGSDSQSVSSDDGHHMIGDGSLVIDESMVQVVQKAVTEQQQQEQQKQQASPLRKLQQPTAIVQKALSLLPQPPSNSNINNKKRVVITASSSPVHHVNAAVNNNKDNSSYNSVLKGSSKAGLSPVTSSSSARPKAPVKAYNLTNSNNSIKLLPPFPTTANEAVVDNNSTEGEFEEKNLSALATIRRLKEMRRNNSNLQQQFASPSSLLPFEEETSAAPTEAAVDVADDSERNNVDSMQQQHQEDADLSITAVDDTINNSYTAVDDVQDNDELEHRHQQQQQQQQSQPHPLTASQLMLYLNTNTHLTNNTTSVGIFQLIQDTIMFNYGEDDFPGLRSLIAANNSNNNEGFIVDLDRYQQGRPAYNDQNAARFALLSRQRKHVSFGLVMLVESCQTLLLGLLQISSSLELLSAWMSALETFDSMAAIQQQLEENVDRRVYMSPVSVCGNGYEVCMKLQSVLRWHYRRNASGANESMSRCLSRASGVRPVGADADDTDYTPELQFQQPNAAIYGHASNSNNSPRTTSYRSINTAGATTTPIALTDEDKQQLTERYKREEMAADDAIADAQMALLETLDRLGLNKADNTFAAANNTNVNASSAAGGNKSSASGRRPSRRQQQQSSSNNTNNNTNNDIDKSKQQQTQNADYRLTDIYPHFAMIFPMAYNTSTRNKGDDITYARNLLETMAVQAAVYEEWIDVMRDYSTVFCYNDPEADGNNNSSKKGVERSKEVYSGNNHALHYRIKSSRSEVTNIVSDVFRNTLLDWEELPPGLGLGLSWNLLWTWSKPRINNHHLLIWQRVNHFEESRQLTRKDFLKRNLQRFTDLPHSLAKEFEIMPMTFLLPHEYTAFITAFTATAAMKTQTAADIGNESGNIVDSSASNANTVNTSNKNYWILKPVGLSRGRGISLIKDLGDLTYSQASVVQRYLERPLCLNGFKFDLRLFVLVTSFQPLEAFIYREGFARVSLEQYSLHANDVDNKFIHLTNSSIQRHHTTGPGKDNPLAERANDVDVGGSKISLLGENGLWNRLFRQGVDVASLWARINVLIVKSLVAVMEKIPSQPCAFELFGYDVLIDADLKPWLLEVNASPSLSRDNALDFRVKNNLIVDIVRLLDVAPYDRAALARIVRRRLNGVAKNRFVHGRNDVELEHDLRDILGDYRPRQVGELPKEMGQFERLCPDTPAMALVTKLKKKLIRE